MSFMKGATEPLPTKATYYKKRALGALNGTLPQRFSQNTFWKKCTSEIVKKVS